MSGHKPMPKSFAEIVRGAKGADDQVTHHVAGIVADLQAAGVNIPAGEVHKLISETLGELKREVNGHYQ